MTIKGRNVIGLKVFTLGTGKEVDTVQDVLFDGLAHRVTALLVKPKSFFSEALVIPLHDVKSIGADAVLIEDAKAIRPASHLPARMTHLTKGTDKLTQTKIVTEEGQSLGLITDIFFDMNQGRIEAFEVSQMQDKSALTTRIEPLDIVTVGQDVILVRASRITQPAPKRSEILAPLPSPATAEPAMSGALGGAVTKQQETVAAATPTKSATPAQPEVDPERLRQRRVAHAVGAYLTKNIISPVDDSVIAKRGQMVTYGLIDQAHQLGVDYQIFANVSHAPVATVATDMPAKPASHPSGRRPKPLVAPSTRM